MYVRGDKCSIMKWIFSNADSVADGRTSVDIHLGAPPTPHSPPEGWIKLLQSHEADGYETSEIKHCFISVRNERNCHQINCSFQMTSINHQHIAGNRRIPELKNSKSGLECVLLNLSSFLPLFQSFPVPPPSRAWEDVHGAGEEVLAWIWAPVQRHSSTLTCSHRIQFHSLVGKFSKSWHLGIKNPLKKLLSAYCAENF